MTSRQYIIPAVLAAAGFFALPQNALAQTLQEGQPGGFDLLVFDPQTTSEWDDLLALVDRAYGSQFKQMPDRSAYVAARGSSEDQAIRMDGDDRVLITAQGLGVPDYLQDGLRATYPNLTAEHLKDFNDGLTIVAISYDNGETALSMALMREFGTEETGEGGASADVSGFVMQITDDVVLAFPDETEIISQSQIGPANSPTNVFATVRSPTPLGDTASVLSKTLEDQGYTPVEADVGDKKTLSVFNNDVSMTLNLAPSDGGAGTVVTVVANFFN